jgi:hypothetical protein
VRRDGTVAGALDELTLFPLRILQVRRVEPLAVAAATVIDLPTLFALLKDRRGQSDVLA